MGFIGIIITVAIMALGAGYFFLDSSGSSLSVENPAAEEQGTGGREQGTESGGSSALTRGMVAIDAAKEAKDFVEQKATETMAQGIGSSQQSVDDSQKKLEENQDSKSAISDSQSEIVAEDRLVSFGYAGSSGRTIDTVVLHSSYNNQGGDRYSMDKVIDIWKSYEVAPHYVIDRKGNIFRLVEDEDTAYHAGNSKMPDGRTDVNKFSIGVEILNAEDDEYTSAQYGAVNDLIAYLKKKHGVKYVVGHDDIAPGRKTDPWNFDWKKLK